MAELEERCCEQPQSETTVPLDFGAPFYGSSSAAKGTVGTDVQIADVITQGLAETASLYNQSSKCISSADANGGRKNSAGISYGALPPLLPDRGAGTGGREPAGDHGIGGGNSGSKEPAADRKTGVGSSGGGGESAGDCRVGGGDSEPLRSDSTVGIERELLGQPETGIQLNESERQLFDSIVRNVRESSLCGLQTALSNCSGLSEDSLSRVSRALQQTLQDIGQNVRVSLRSQSDDNRPTLTIERTFAISPQIVINDQAGGTCQVSISVEAGNASGVFRGFGQSQSLVGERALEEIVHPGRRTLRGLQ